MYESDSKKIKTGLLLLSLMVIIMGAVIFKQQRDVNILLDSRQLDQDSNLPAQNALTLEKQPDFNQMEEVAKQLTSNTRSVMGVISSISAEQIVIKTKLVDFSKLATIDYDTQQPLPAIEKELTIKISGDTKIQSTNALNAGDAVAVVTNELVYADTVLTAVSIDKF